MRVFLPLRNPPTALLWGGLSLSALGDQLYAVALTWIAVGVLGSGAGYLAAVNAGVMLLAVLGLGRWADGWDQRRSMIAADLVRAGVLLVTVAAWMAMGRPSAPMLVLAVVVLATGQAVFQPALQAVLPAVVGDTRLLPAANGLLDTTDRSARLLGPGMIGLLAAMVPVMHFLTLDALSFVGSAAALALIGRFRPEAVQPAHRPAGPREPVWHGIRRGAAAMRSHPLLGFVLSTSGWLNGSWYAAYFLALPLLVERRGITGPALWSGGGSGLGAFGLIISAYGSTNLAATLVLGSRPLPERLPRLMFGGKLLTGAGTVLLGMAAALPDAWLLPALAAAAAVSAIGGPMGDIPTAVLRQSRLPRGTIAAAMRATIAVNSIGVLVAMLLAPTALRVVGPSTTIIACGAIMGAVGLAGFARHANWHEHQPSA